MKHGRPSPGRWGALPVTAALLLVPSLGEAASPAVTSTPVEAPPPSPPPPNRAPRWPEGPTRDIPAKTGVPLRIEILAVDADLDPVTYSVSGQPKEAALLTRPGPGASATLEWTPGEQDIGTRDVTITASDGKAEAAQTLRVHVDDEWSGIFLPGVQYSAYLPAAAGKWGFFQGISAEIRAYSWIRKNASPGPSHGSIYVDMDLLASSRANVANAFHLSTGVELSFEPNPSRRYLLPVFGLEVGALFQRQVLTTVGEISPTAGLYLWASPRLVIDLRAGYMLPLSAATFDDLRGLRAKLGLSFSLW